ncbi:MAG: ATP-binding cassette domain-containing protein, partial [Bacteroidota bacterium]
DTGKVIVGDTIVFGYFTQSGIQLDQDRRVIDVIRDIADYIPMKKGYKLTAEQLLERFLFSRPHQQVYVSKLSGGERRRLYLLTILMKNPNFLILDEPTNDLDILTLNILEDFLAEFPGCVIIVSHDRFMLDKLADHLFIFEGNGIIKDYNGKYSDYRALLKERHKSEQKIQQKSKKEAKEKTAQQDSGLSYEDRKKIKRLERDIERLEEKKAQIQEKFLDASLPLEEIQKLSKELDEIKEKIEEKEMEWMELAE